MDSYNGYRYETMVNTSKRLLRFRSVKRKFPACNFLVVERPSEKTRIA